MTATSRSTRRLYQIYRSGTDALYPIESLPIYAVADTKALVASDDIAVMLDDGSEVDLLMNAVPILDDDGNITRDCRRLPGHQRAA